ncbi:MAG: hypothetical protein E7458_08535 [Ruminococcaceae bacterium]|nr:hypothetical protein [Oscillospiraceae bacterium]
MDKRTRVLNAMNKLGVDHVPVGFWFHFSGEEEVGETCVQAHLKYYRETDLDFLKVMNDHYAAYPIPEITCAADFAKIPPMTADHPFIAEQVERARRIVQEIGQERCVFYNIFAPFSNLRNGAQLHRVSDADVMRYLKEDPASVMKGLDVVAQGCALLGELLITEAGCDGIYFCVQGGEHGRFTEEEYRKYIMPSDLYVLEHINRYSDNNILHMCGWAGKANHLEFWQNYPAKVYNWAVHVEGLDLEEGRYFAGGRTTLGGFETLWDGRKMQGLIYHGTKEEIQAYTRELILNHGKTGLMLGGDCTVDAAIDWEHIRWVVEAARSL